MNLLVSWLLPCLSPFMLILFAIICCLFWIYRKIVDILLRIRIGDRYGGLLNYSDAFAVFNDISPCLICSMLIIKSDKEIDLANLIRSRMKKMVFDSSSDYSKLKCTLHTYAGYAYLLKESVKLSDCFKTFPAPVNETYDEDYVKKVVEKVYNSPLPCNNTATWEILVGEKPMVTKSGEKTIYRYPVHMRFHHFIADGASKLAFSFRLLGLHDKDFNEEVFHRKSKNISTKKNQVDYLFDLLKNVLEISQLIFLVIFFMLKKRLELIYWREQDKNALHGVELLGEKFMVWKAEESVELLPLTKHIKNAIPGLKFGNVVFAALSLTFANFFRKYDGGELPKHISIFSTVRLEFPQVDKNKPIPLENKSSAVLQEIPIKGFTNPKQLLLKVKENSEKATFFEAWVNQLFLRYLFALFPLSIRTQLHNLGAYTAIVSNIPAGKLLILHDGCCVEKIVAAPPCFTQIGMGMVVLTYDDRYQIGLLVDKALMSSQKQAQDFVDNVFYNIKLLAKEVLENKTKNF